MDNDEFGRMLFESLVASGAGGKNNGKKIPAETHQKQVSLLTEVYERFKEINIFKEGDLIIPKENCNLWVEGYKHVMVVIEVLDKPVRGFQMTGEAAQTGSPYSSLLYDIVAAYVDSNGDFVEHMFDSRRFKKYDHKKNVIDISNHL